MTLIPKDLPPERVIETLGPYLTDERKARIEEILAGRLSGVTVILENLHDPHNGAAALRSIEGFGMSELHVVESLEPFRFAPTVSSGAEKWIQLTRYKTFKACADGLKARGIKLYAALPNAEMSLSEIDVAEPAALVFGNEHDGLSKEAVAHCDASFTIPMAGFTQSFNLSVSVAICAHDVSHRRRVALNRPSDIGEQERARLRARWYALSMDGRMAAGLLDRVSR
jgi:tRNA (guanosine-2'-O-)-methyltransferase